jgi:hypothetical protein
VCANTNLTINGETLTALSSDSVNFSDIHPVHPGDVYVPSHPYHLTSSYQKSLPGRTHYVRFHGPRKYPQFDYENCFRQNPVVKIHQRIFI